MYVQFFDFIFRFKVVAGQNRSLHFFLSNEGKNHSVIIAKLMYLYNVKQTNNLNAVPKSGFLAPCRKR